MLHQMQIEGQLLEAQALKKGQHVLALVGGQKVVGVLNTALNALQRLKGAKGHAAQQIARIFIGNFGENSHGECAGLGRPTELAGIRCLYATGQCSEALPCHEWGKSAPRFRT